MNPTTTDTIAVTTDPMKLGHKIISPTCSAGNVSNGAASLDVNSNGMFSNDTPEAKGSITSKSEVNYPIIDNHSRIYDSRQNPKLVRFVTVIAYIFSVSLAAIVLSFYYLFLWDPHMEGRIALEPGSAMTQPQMGNPMETFRSGRKRVSIQHNINHFPLEATSFRLPVPSVDTMTFPVPTARPQDCDKKIPPLSAPASLVDQASEIQDYESHSTSPSARLSRSDSYQALESPALPWIGGKSSVTTVPTLYEMIVRRFSSMKTQTSDAITDPSTMIVSSAEA